ncbi:hypothetical protein [Streptomyces clavuligerus]|uniref:hypothetical protein n=2 Tax=Streptomyces clavuligerus TaxID=1901 RepID=UPI0018CFFFBC|nr:hypothetical protein [Streptomyces clavuligerus]WDN55894.1 hypothetical protein LL058_28770 [Streptomyces clavuligerus]
MTHTDALTLCTPQRQRGLHMTGMALSPVALRQMATGESEETARAELAGLEHLIPAPTSEQARGEARIFQALIAAYGRHRPAHTGGPFGIRSLTPRSDALVLRIAHSQLDRWIDALAFRESGTGSVAGLRWASSHDGTDLMLPGMRLLLAGVGETEWRAALGRRSAGQSSLMPHWIPRIRREPELSNAQDAELAGLADLLSATLRRIRLLDPLTRISGHVHLFITRHHGDLHLIEACEATPTVLPLWTSRSVPLALWPAALVPRAGLADPRTAVLGLLAEAEPSHAPASASDRPAARALCHIAGLPSDPVLVQAADHVLDVAARVLADPAHASVYAAGGWSGSCRTYPEGTVHGSDPCLPPGAEAVILLPEESLERIGRNFSSRPSDTSRADLVAAGQEELVHLLDWALAAATRPAGLPAWTRDRTDGALLRAQPLPGHDATLSLTATTTGVYRVSLEALGLEDLDAEDGTVEWEREAAPSQSAAVLLAEHAAIEAAVCLPFQREHHKHRLLVPATAPAEPTIRSVIEGADHVLGFFTLAGILGHLHERVGSAHGAADGHWRPDGHSGTLPDSPATLTALVSDWCALPSPHHGEAANTAPVDSPAYLHHLAAHRAALDPFVTRYLAAADTLTGARTLEERHLAGVAALRTADLSALARTEVRPVREGLLRLVRSIPQDTTLLNYWYERHLGQG